MATNLPVDAIRTAWQDAGLDSGALQAMRRDALEDFLRRGLPSTRQENWKYTNISKLAERLPDSLRRTAPPTPAAADTLDIPDAVHIVFLDGLYSDALSNAGSLPDGVTLSSLDALAAAQPDTLKNMWGQLAPEADSALVALNSAFAGHGVVLQVADGVTLQQPVCITYRSERAGAAAQPRLLVSLGRDATATVIEHYCSTAAAFVNPVAELRCAAGAQLDYCKLQNEHVETWHTAVQYARLAENAEIHTTQIDIGGELVRNELKLSLAGRHAHADARGLFMANGKRHVESRIDVNHEAPDTTSRERFRGILGDRARGVFNGRIFVAQEAQKTAAELTNRNLLLSNGAEINTKPELEIYADDVKCAHGSTTGQLDANSHFYLLSRGIDPQTARNMLITAFAAELLTDIKFPAIAAKARQALEALQSDVDIITPDPQT